MINSTTTRIVIIASLISTKIHHGQFVYIGESSGEFRELVHLHPQHQIHLVFGSRLVEVNVHGETGCNNSCFYTSETKPLKIKIYFGEKKRKRKEKVGYWEKRQRKHYTSAQKLRLLVCRGMGRVKRRVCRLGVLSECAVAAK